MHNTSRYLSLTASSPPTAAAGIPCFIHQQWKVNGRNGTKLESWVHDSVASFKNKNKNCDHRLWSDDEINSFISDEYGEILPMPLWLGLKPIQRADLFRYAVVLRLGGFYADSDVNCLKGVSEWGLQLNTKVMIGYETGRHLDEATRRHVGFARNEQFEQWFFGAAPGHPIFSRCLELFRLKFDWGIENTVELTGPGLFSDAVREFLHGEAQKRGVPYPSTFQQGDQLSYPPPGYPEEGILILSAEEVAVPGYSAPSTETKRTLIRHNFKGSWKTDEAEKLSMGKQKKEIRPPDAWHKTSSWPQCIVTDVHLRGEDSALFVDLHESLSKKGWQLAGCSDPQCEHTDKFGVSNPKDLDMLEVCPQVCQATQDCEYWFTGVEDGVVLCWLRKDDDGYHPEKAGWKAGRKSCSPPGT
jgi:hypothetical protein